MTEQWRIIRKVYSHFISLTHPLNPEHSLKKKCAKEDAIHLIVSVLREHPNDNDLAKQAYAALGKLGEVGMNHLSTYNCP